MVAEGATGVKASMAVTEATKLRLEPDVERKHDVILGDYVSRADIKDSRGRVVASIMCRPHTFGREEGLANLFASAPDLVEALSSTLCYRCDVMFGEPLYPDQAECPACAEKRALVAKARSTQFQGGR